MSNTTKKQQIIQNQLWLGDQIKRLNLSIKQEKGKDEQYEGLESKETINQVRSHTRYSKMPMNRILLVLSTVIEAIFNVFSNLQGFHNRLKVVDCDSTYFRAHKTSFQTRPQPSSIVIIAPFVHILWHASSKMCRRVQFY